MPDSDRLAAIEAEVKALRALMEHVYFGGWTTVVDGKLVPGSSAVTSARPVQLADDHPLRRYSNC